MRYHDLLMEIRNAHPIPKDWIPPTTNRGLTARQLMHHTIDSNRRRGKYVWLNEIVREKEMDGRDYFLASTVTDPGHITEAQIHHQYIVLLTKGENRNIADSRTRLKVSCDCSDFKYRWEYALWKKGAADINYSNGKYPESTNPWLMHGVCKHLYAILGYLLHQYKNKE